MVSFLKYLLQPSKLFFKIWELSHIGSFAKRLQYDIFPRPHYAFCVYHAARLAKCLGIKEISVLEFGVAGGNGLVALERVAEEVEKEFGVKIKVYGFDTGEGLPAPKDFRDLPYVWQAGFFKMDVPALKKRLSRSELVLGDVAVTVPEFLKGGHPPIGAVMLDLDYYSSTADALQLMESEYAGVLPRIYCYCDDVISNEYGGIYCDSVGQLGAIKDLNQKWKDRCLSQIAGFGVTRKRPAAWNEQIYVGHFFMHPDYNTYVHKDKNRQLPLEG